MRTRRHPAISGIATLILITLACNVLASTPTVSNVRMTTDQTGKTTTSSYAPGDEFCVFADLSGLTAGSVVEARWYAVNVDGMDPNTELNASDYNYEPGVGFVYFQLSTSDGGDWPAGSYRVVIFVDGTKAGEQGFIVE